MSEKKDIKTQIIDQTNQFIKDSEAILNITIVNPLPENASYDNIKTALKKLMVKIHPDATDNLKDAEKKQINDIYTKVFALFDYVKEFIEGKNPATPIWITENENGKNTSTSTGHTETDGPTYNSFRTEHKPQYYTDLIIKAMSNRKNFVGLTRRYLEQALDESWNTSYLFKGIYLKLKEDLQESEPEKALAAVLSIYILYFEVDDNSFKNQIETIASCMNLDESFSFYDTLYKVLPPNPEESQKNKFIDVFIYLVEFGKIKGYEDITQFMDIFDNDKQLVKLIGALNKNRYSDEDIIDLIKDRINSNPKKRRGENKKIGASVLEALFSATTLKPEVLFELLKDTTYKNDGEILSLIRTIYSNKDRLVGQNAYKRTDIADIIFLIGENNPTKFGHEVLEFTVSHLPLKIYEVCDMIEYARLSEQQVDTYLRGEHPVFHVLIAEKDIQLELYSKKAEAIVGIKDQDERNRRYEALKNSIYDPEIRAKLSKDWDKRIDPTRRPSNGVLNFMNFFAKGRRPSNGDFR